MDNLQQYDAIGLAALISSKQISVLEVIEDAISRIEQLNPTLNAVIATDFDSAIEQVKNANHSGVLAGVPYLVKDLNVFVAGLPSTNGSRAFADLISPRDSELVRRLRGAGLIILGKTNTPEFGLNICTNPSLFGATKNPVNTDYSAGGSSGGSASAVAAGMVPIAHATDSGGSIRIPASNCGLFGLKPSRGRVPLGNDQAEGLAGFSTGHAVTHSVRDSALLLDITSGPMNGDIYAATSQAEPFLHALDKPLAPLKVACWDKGFADEVVHADCREAVKKVGALCEQLGCQVEYAKPPVDGYALRQAFDVLFSANISRLIQVIEVQKPGHDIETLIEPITYACAQSASNYSAADYVKAIQVTQQAARDLGQFFVQYDVLLTPTLANPPLLVGEMNMQSDNWPSYLERMLNEIPFTPLFNATGAPAASLPLAKSSNNLPVGVQIGGPLGSEAKLLNLSRHLELIAPWHDKK